MSRTSSKRTAKAKQACMQLVPFHEYLHERISSHKQRLSEGTSLPTTYPPINKKTIVADNLNCSTDRSRASEQQIEISDRSCER
jgi:hypothetical protein